jgi:hypothetical protein
LYSPGNSTKTHSVPYKRGLSPPFDIDIQRKIDNMKVQIEETLERIKEGISDIETEVVNKISENGDSLHSLENILEKMKELETETKNTLSFI